MYPHQGGRWERCQFSFAAVHASSEEFSDVSWSEMLGISEHIASYLQQQGIAIGQMARYVEVRAIRATVTGSYFPTTSVTAVSLFNRVFCGFCVDTFDRNAQDGTGAPESAPLFDPFANEYPVRLITSAGITMQNDITQPTRWLRTDWHHFNGGSINGSAGFQSNSAQLVRHFTVSRRFRLDDHHKLYCVTGFSSNTTELAPVTYTFAVQGALWYRVIF